MTFEELKLNPSILKAVQDKNYERPTPIQEKAIPIINKGKDLLGCAQTGTGKTAAFSIPIIQKLENQESQVRAIRCLILTPTRELAIQVNESIGDYSKYTSLRHTVIYGGVKQTKQVERLKRGVDILVATPGRLLDLINQGFIKLDQIQVFVLDEADRMLDMGFIHDIRKVVKLLPKRRQSLFFSATMPKEITNLAQTILYKPTRVEANPVSSAAKTIKQYVYLTNKSLKRQLLLHILAEIDAEQVLLFSRTKHGANRIARDLSKKKVSAAAIHGDKSQNQRQNALNDFKNKSVRVLVATDIASRGIDIDKLKYVINYDVPNEPESYIHRIGRSGRAGEEGIAISICEPEELDYLAAIKKLNKDEITEVKDHPYPQTDKPMTAAEKKEANKEKERRKQEFFANRKKQRANRNKGGGNKNNRRPKNK